MSLKYLPSWQNELVCIRRLRVQCGFCFCSHRCVATEMCCCCCCLPPPPGVCVHQLLLLVSYVQPLLCVIESSKMFATFTFCPWLFLSPPCFGIYEQRAHNVTTTTFLRFFSSLVSPPPPFFPFVAELRRCVAVQRNIKRKKKKKNYSSAEACWIKVKWSTLSLRLRCVSVLGREGERCWAPFSGFGVALCHSCS